MHKLKIITAVAISVLLLTTAYAAPNTIPPPNMKDYQPAPPMSAGDFNSHVETLDKQNKAALNQGAIQTLSSPPMVAPPAEGGATSPSTTKPPAAVDQTPPPSDDDSSTVAPLPKKPEGDTSDQSTTDTDKENTTGFGNSAPSNTGKSSTGGGWDIKY